MCDNFKVGGRQDENDRLNTLIDQLLEKESTLTTKIGNVELFDYEQEKFIHGQLELADCGYEFFHRDGSNKSFFLEGKDIEIYLEPLQDTESEVVAIINDAHFVVTKEKYDLIVQHFDTMNEAMRKRKYIFKQEVENLVKDFYMDASVKEIGFSFFSRIPYDVFLYTQNIIALEHLVLFDSPDRIGELTLMSDQSLRNIIMMQFREDEAYYDMMKEFKDEYFDMFIKVIVRKLDFPSQQHCVFTMLALLKIFAVEYYANLWEEEYGEHFLGVPLDKNHFLKAYCNIDIVDYIINTNAMKMTYYMIHKGLYGDILEVNLIDVYNYNADIIINEDENRKVKNFELELFSSKEEKKTTIDDIDLMDGYEFESFISLLFSKMGYSTSVTKASGDQGIDIIAQKNSRKLGIQVKCYSSQVSNSAIQEVVAGIKHYNLDKAVVVTNNYFSKSAQELAKSNNVVLWDRNILNEKIKEVF